jgi:hypothetical protein
MHVNRDSMQWAFTEYRVRGIMRDVESCTCGRAQIRMGPHAIMEENACVEINTCDMGIIAM